MFSSSTNTFLLLAGIATVSCYYYILNRQYKRKLPPGPKGLPIVGNALDLPSVRQWETFRDWGNRYGDTVFLDLPLQPTIILCSTEAALDLLDRRSHIYSDRITSVMGDLTTWSCALSILPYGAEWRAHRKLFHQHFNSVVIPKYLPVQIGEVRAFLKRLLASPEDLNPHIRHTFSASVLKIIYGVEVTSIYDEYISTAKKAAEVFGLINTPGKFWIEYFPFLRNIPSWVPGAHFKRFAEYAKPIVQAQINRPFDLVKEASSKGTASPSIVASLIQDLEDAEREDPNDEELPSKEWAAREIAGTAFAAASDTTIGSAMSFFVGMAKYPEVQAKAQAYLDLHVGRERLPDYSDLETLPYIQAIAMEALRWMPPLPLGLPHGVTADDEYKGYFIPKGTMIWPNAWGMLHDPKDYPDPERFNPDRFLKEDGSLNPNVLDPSVIVFGFGRRICPGRHLSNVALFLFIASTLHAYEIKSKKDAQGRPLAEDVLMTSGLLSVPDSLPCDVELRWSGAKRLILEATNAH